MTTRRDVLRGTGVAALAAGAAVVPFAVNTKISAGGGELAGLIKLYWQQVHEFNNAEHITDDESDSYAAATYEATLQRIVGVPAKSREDALAAMDWLMREHADFGYQYGDTDNSFGSAVTWLTDEVIRYIAVS
jgi:hypothetical protein